jgi:hypothetical protein
MHRALFFVAFGSAPLRHLSVLEILLPCSSAVRRVVELTAYSFININAVKQLSAV